jgi:ribosomal protein S18 acetylase RimI-like enzyme
MTCPQPEIVLRAAEPRDYAAVNDLATALLDLRADRRTFFASVLASRDHDLIVAEVDGAVVGFAHLMTYDDLAHGALSGELLGIVVRQELRGRGVGRALLAEVCRLAKARGVAELHINTEPDNQVAQNLYQSFGAKTVGVQMELEPSCESKKGAE